MSKINRIQKRKKALNGMKSLYENKKNILIIHYSCESFFNIKDGKTPRVTSIAVRYFDSCQTVSFSIHKIAEKKKVNLSEIEEKYDDLE